MLFNKEIRNIIIRALKEDSAKQDLTTNFSISPAVRIKSKIIAKEKGVLCGVEVVKKVFKRVDRGVSFKILAKDGAKLYKGKPIIIVEGRAKSILAAERVSLNFLSHLSGVATTTKKFVDKAKNKRVKIMDTRKTTPNLRKLQKYAVRVGGGDNQRECLASGILIKDNHLKAGKYIYKGKLDNKEIKQLLKKIKDRSSKPIEVEVETLAEFRKVIKYKPDIIMLDNFSIANLKRAVNLRKRKFPKVRLEASGSISLNNIRAVANTGVDRISIGRLTHSFEAVDFSLDVITTNAG